MTTWDMTTIAEKMRSWEPETKDNMNRDGGRVSWVIFGCNLTSTEALPRKPQDEFQPVGKAQGALVSLHSDACHAMLTDSIR